jgi:hypothetical protein
MLVVGDYFTCIRGGESRNISMIAFVVEGNSNKSFVENLLDEPKLAVGFWDGRTGKAYRPKKHTKFQITWYGQTGHREA